MPKINHVLLNPKDRLLLLHFIKREATDYGPAKDNEWIDGAFKQTIKAIEKSTAWRVTIDSIGNTGVRIRRLELDTTNWQKTHKDITITFCNCGKLNHLISVEKT